MQHQTRQVTAIVALLGIAAIPVVARSQAPEIHGLTGGVAFGGMRWHQEKHESPGDVAGGLYVGYRIPLGEHGGARLSLTPQLSMMMTNFRGIALNSDEVGVSREDLGLQFAARVGNVRPYLLAQLGRITTEQYSGPDLVNYVGGMRAFGAGTEIPLDKCGAGLDFTVRYMSGNVTGGEWRRKDSNPPPLGPMNVLIFTAGWSGRFRGTHLLFTCN